MSNLVVMDSWFYLKGFMSYPQLTNTIYNLFTLIILLKRIKKMERIPVATPEIFPRVFLKKHNFLQWQFQMYYCLVVSLIFLSFINYNLLYYCFINYKIINYCLA